MPVRLRITFLFSILVFIILGFVCAGIYYFSYTARLNTIKTRLLNRGMTTARLLTQREIFDRELVRQIDSLTTISLVNKTVQAYGFGNRRIYTYSDVIGDTLVINNSLLARWFHSSLVLPASILLVRFWAEISATSSAIFLTGRNRPAEKK